MLEFLYPSIPLPNTLSVNEVNEANRTFSFRIQPRCFLECCFLRLRLRWMHELGGTVVLYKQDLDQFRSGVQPDSLGTRTAGRSSSHIPWTIVHLTGRVKKVYGKTFATKGCWLSGQRSTNAFLIAWQTRVSYELINRRYFMDIFCFSGLYSSHRFFLETCLGSCWSAQDWRLPRAEVWGQPHDTRTRVSRLLGLSSLLGEKDAVSHGSRSVLDIF